GAAPGARDPCACARAPANSRGTRVICALGEVGSPGVIVTSDDLGRAAARLRNHPLDTGAWLEVAVILHALGHTDDAELAFATIGEGARIGGQVALAIACARHLADLGSVRGPELIERIIETYATGKPEAASVPPRAQRSTEPPPTLPPAADDPLSEARAVL